MNNVNLTNERKMFVLVNLLIRFDKSFKCIKMNNCTPTAKTIESQALNHRMPFREWIEWIDTRNNLNNQKKMKETMFFGSFVQRFDGAERQHQPNTFGKVSIVRTRTLLPLVCTGQRAKLIKSADVLFIFARSVCVCLTFEQYFVFCCA